MPLHDVRSVHLPYYVQRQKDGRYAILNRERMPLGSRSRRSDLFEAVLVGIKGLTPKRACEISVHGKDDINDIYLYDDACFPTLNAQSLKDYMKRLSVLAKLQIPPEKELRN